MTVAKILVCEVVGDWERLTRYFGQAIFNPENKQELDRHKQKVVEAMRLCKEFGVSYSDLYSQCYEELRNGD